MGTNYYFKAPEKEPCACCGRPYETERLHIGKSSMGWCFSLHAIPELGLTDWPEWERYLETANGEIVDEYRCAVTLDELRQIVTERRHERPATVPLGYTSWANFYASNMCRPGPNGLVRHASPYCLKNGEGTWDVIEGEFS